MHVGRFGPFCLHHLRPKPDVKPGHITIFSSLTVSFTVQLLALTCILGKIGREVAAKTKSWIWLRTHTIKPQPTTGQNPVRNCHNGALVFQTHLNSLLSSSETNDCQSLKLISLYFNHQMSSPASVPPAKDSRLQSVPNSDTCCQHC